MVYYPLATLMLAGIREILLITTPTDRESFERLLGDGSQLGISILYAEQPTPGGLAQAFTIGREFIGSHRSCLVLGDNIFFGAHFGEALRKAANRTSGATVFAYRVQDPERYGVVELDTDGRAVSLEEKPQQPRSQYAVTGLYFFDNDVVDIAAKLQPSARGELEIIDVIQTYLTRNRLTVQKLARGNAWLDTGTQQSLIQASQYVQAIEDRQGTMIGCLEEIAFQRRYITATQLERLADSMPSSPYGLYLRQVLEESRGPTSLPQRPVSGI
jgi:glucose-1-phosphate thymidylyltransferase